MIVVQTVRLDTVPQEAEPPVNEQFDIFFEYETQGDVRLVGKTMPTPKLQGVSGGSILQYVPRETPFWTPEKTMRLVALQSGASSGRKWFRGKNWRAIATAFDKHDATLSLTIRQHLGILN